ncbi:MAG TPA: hypothetical protein DDY77_04045 [Clostridiales bacterium]|nr:hypothetical protein [Clostridiales bacterium]
MSRITFIGDLMDLKNYSPKGILSASSVLSVEALPSTDILEILSEALNLKKKSEFGESIQLKNTPSVALVTSNRIGASRLAFEVAASSIGAKAITLPIGGSNIDAFLSTPECVKAIGKLGISAFFVGTAMKKDAFTLSESLKSLSVINACTDDGPVVALAALLTVYERIGRLSGIKACFLGNVSSHENLLFALSKCGADITVTSDDEEELFEKCKQYSDVAPIEDPFVAAAKADVIYVDSTSDEYVLNEEIMAAAKDDCVILHTVPLSASTDVAEKYIPRAEDSVADVIANIMHVERAIISLIAKK